MGVGAVRGEVEDDAMPASGTKASRFSAMSRGDTIGRRKDHRAARSGWLRLSGHRERPAVVSRPHGFTPHSGDSSPPSARSTRAGAGSKSCRDDDLAAGVSRGEVADCVRDLVQRDHFVDDGRERARLDQRSERVEVRRVLLRDERPEALAHEG